VISGLILKGLAVAAIATTITRSKTPLFYPLRKYYLFRCPYCLGHWVAFAVCWKEIYELDFITPFAVITIAAIAGIGIERYFKELEIQ
jgi:hypothetical protein